jgi:putative DNA primase/helicase
MSSNHWPKVNREHPCPRCGKPDRCTIAPDGHAGHCFRDGRTWRNGNGANGNSTGYVGAAHRPKPTAKSGTTYPTAEAAAEAAARQCGGTVAGTWSYTDAQRQERMRVVRIALADGEKDYRPIRRAKGNGWRFGDPSGPLPLYGLAELPATGTVYVVEGERCADTAGEIGLPATTSAHGSAAAEKSDWTPLAGRDVVILPDADEPGRKYARDVARLLVRLDSPARVKIVTLPALSDGEDIVQYLERGGTRESIDTLAAGTPWLSAADLIGGPVLTCLADVEPVEVRWLWRGRIPMGRITLLVGRPGEGKSFVTMDWAARVSTGTAWPDGEPCERGSVLIVSAEDDPADTIRPRLDAHHADVSRIHVLSAVRRVGEDGGSFERCFTLADLPDLEAAIKTHRPALIIIDPIGSYMGGEVDSHRDTEVRSVLAPVAALAAKYGVAVVVVAHRRKSAGDIADDLAMGSRAFTGIARAVWHLCRDADAEQDAKDREQITGRKSPRRLLLAGKMNLCTQPHGLAFTIAGDPPSIRWEREPVQMSADDALAVENGNGEREKPGPEPVVRNMATDWLRAELADLAEHPVGALKKAAEAAGVGSWKTVQRAAQEIGVFSQRATFGGGYVWRLPKPGTLQDTMQDKPPENEGTCPPVPQGEIPTKHADCAGQIPLQDKSVSPVPHDGEVDEYDWQEREALQQEGM